MHEKGDRLYDAAVTLLETSQAIHAQMLAEAELSTVEISWRVFIASNAFTQLRHRVRDYQRMKDEGVT